MQWTIRALPEMSRCVIADLKPSTVVIVDDRTFAALLYRLFASGIWHADHTRSKSAKNLSVSGDCPERSSLSKFQEGP